MSKYYTNPPEVIDGDVAYAGDVNDINSEAGTGFTLVQVDIEAQEATVEAWALVAKSWAEELEDTPVEPGQYSALHWAAKASADVVITNADVVLTHEDVVLTGLDVGTTNDNVVLTGNDVASTNADVLLTHEDVRLTGLDVDATNADVITTGVSRDKAEEWAQNPEDVPVETGEFSARHWATKAEASALSSVKAVVGTAGEIDIDSVDPENPVVSIGTAFKDNIDLKSYIATTVEKDSSTGAAVIPTGTTAERPTGTAGDFRFNTEEESFEGFNGIEWGAVGGGLLWLKVATDTTAEVDKAYILDTDTAGADVTLTLPLAPEVGDQVGITEIGSNYDCIIARNGSLIQGIADDLKLDGDNQTLMMVYAGATEGWRVVWASPICAETPVYAASTARKNLIINGNGLVNQRGVVSSQPLASGDYSVDRFQTLFQGSVTNPRLKYYTTIPDGGSGDDILFGFNVEAFDKTGTNYIIPLRHRVEGNNCTQLIKGGKVTLSFMAFSSTAGIHCLRVICYNDIADKVILKNFTIDTAEVAQKIVVTLDIPAGYVGYLEEECAIDLTIGNIGGPDRVGTPDVWSEDTTRLSTTDCVDWSAVGIQRFMIGLVQLELGAEATDFEYRSYGEELALCQRYYQKHNANALVNGLTDSFVGQIDLPVTMRSDIMTVFNPLVDSAYFTPPGPGQWALQDVAIGSAVKTGTVSTFTRRSKSWLIFGSSAGGVTFSRTTNILTSYDLYFTLDVEL